MSTNIHDNQSKEYSLAETKRHKPCLIYRGHRYVQDKIQNRTIYWRCEDRSHCNGRAHQLVGNGSLPVLTIKHNHAPIIEDLSRHDIVSVDSHRRRRRQNRKMLSNHSNEKDDLQFSLSSSNMSSPIKRENLQNKQQQQHAAMVKNLHLSEVITTAVAPNIHQSNNMITLQQNVVDPIEMTKLLSNITTTLTNSPAKKLRTSSTMDQPSRANQFSWEEMEGRYVPVIYRNESGIKNRYTSKMYVENTLFQSESWQRHLALARSLPPLVSYSYTEYELKLFRFIIEWHLASFNFKTIPSTDCLIRFEDLLEFYNTLRRLRDSASSTTFNRPIAPLPPPTSLSAQPTSTVPLKPNLQSQSIEVPTQVVSPIKKQSKAQLLPQNPDASLQTNRSPEQLTSSPKSPKESGWVQINNVFVPYIVKIKLRENELNKCHTRQPAPQLQREFYVPYEILIKCNIFSDNEFSFKKLLIKATQHDFDILNNLITNINIFDEKVPEKTLLVNLYHVMMGLDRILYIKFLPTKHPRTQVNKYHANVLTHKGGTLLMNGNKLIPYIVQNNRFYVPLLYTFQSLPNILLQAKRSARAPRQYEIDYLNLLFIYFSIGTSPLLTDTLLVDIFNIKCSNLQSPVHFRTLHEHQQYEKTKLSKSSLPATQTSKSTTGSPSTHKTSKCPPANVVVNPMIHHPSFYGIPSPKSVTSHKQPEIKTIILDNHSLNAIIKSSDIPIRDWKISIKDIFQKFSFDIDYQIFIQWCQTNLLLPLIKLDEEEKKLVKNSSDNDYYIYQRHLERCLELLNDLKSGTINMTLLSTSSNDESQQQQMNKSTLAGAKKRKTTVPTTRHINPISTDNETNPRTNSVSHDIEHLSPELPLPDELVPSIVNDIPMKSPNNQVICSIITNNDNAAIDDDDDIMPVVASVEEGEPIEELNHVELDTSFVIVETNDYNDEKIQLDDAIPSCSSGYESSAALNHVDTNNHEDEDEKNLTICFKDQTLTKSLKSPMIFSTNNKKSTKKRQRYKYGKSRIRPRSTTATTTTRVIKKARSYEDDDVGSDLSLTTIITSEQIEQHLRTLFMSSIDLRRTRTRSVKSPARLVEKINTNDNNNSIKAIEPDSNVFDILSSSTATEPINDNESAQDIDPSCTYNVMITNKPNKLGLTIKKVVQPEL
ncbi:unnamed protein product [Adineta steineri]|uniref:FLYWCH-type domain-containing protein n=1 Tax=Adineta steineri TaxID=433720 RepID=A0A819D9W3_9BILA|nr:unnamed protein product [Adineta steineri]CAF3830099.1 unnamed protein product [Adineta steineri]